MGRHEAGHDDAVEADVVDDEGTETVDEERMTTPPLDIAAANAALPGEEHLGEREAAGTDEWARLDEGAGITGSHTRSNWRVT